MTCYRDFKKLTSVERKRFAARLAFFTADPFHSLLGNHALRGKYEGYRSIAVSDDLRVIYKPVEPDTAVFVAIGTHSKLYDK